VVCGTLLGFIVSKPTPVTAILRDLYFAVTNAAVGLQLNFFIDRTHNVKIDPMMLFIGV
jgi:hypothetical protein